MVDRIGPRVQVKDQLCAARSYLYSDVFLQRTGCRLVSSVCTFRPPGGRSDPGPHDCHDHMAAGLYLSLLFQGIRIGSLYHGHFHCLHMDFPCRSCTCVHPCTAHERAGYLVRHVHRLDLPDPDLCDPLPPALYLVPRFESNCE